VKAVILKVKPNSRFHFGKVALDSNTGLQNTDSFIHSDLLFSALICNMAKYAGKVETDKLVHDFENEKFKVSSGFYCIEYAKGKYIYLLPKPVNAQNLLHEYPDMKYEDIKKIKKIQFVSTQVLKKEITVEKWTDKEYCRELGKSIVTKEEFEKIKSLSNIYSKHVAPQVNVHKTNESGGLYNIASIQIAECKSDFPKIHFYVMYDDSKADEDAINRLHFAFKILKYEGIGGERSIGLGKIEDIHFSNEVDYSLDSSVFMNLGVFMPASDEEFNSVIYYNFITRGGRKTANNGRLKYVRVITEGSIFSKYLSGKIEKLHKSSDYKRLGKALMINIPELYGH